MKKNLKKLILISCMMSFSIFSAKAMNQNQQNQNANILLNQEIDFNNVNIDELYGNEKINEITGDVLEFLKDEKQSEFKDLKESKKAGWTWQFLTDNLYSNFYHYVIYTKFFPNGINGYVTNLEEIENLGKLYDIVKINENNKTIDFNIERIENKEILNKLKKIIKIYSNKNEEEIRNLSNKEIRLFKLYIYLRKFVDINNKFNGIIQ